jgi:hypothetical protein
MDVLSAMPNQVEDGSSWCCMVGQNEVIQQLRPSLARYCVSICFLFGKQENLTPVLTEIQTRYQILPNRPQPPSYVFSNPQIFLTCAVEKATLKNHSKLTYSLKGLLLLCSIIGHASQVLEI